MEKYIIIPPMSIYDKIRKDLENITEKLKKNFAVEEEFDLTRFSVENPRDESHGDISTNVAMIFCKQFRKNPRELAEVFCKELEGLDYVKKAEVAGPGFVNLSLENSAWYEVLKEVLKQGQDYGYSNLGKGEKVNIDYASVNPTGPMHVGHTRGAIFGDVLASLLKKTGYDVTKEYYINDAGNQIKTLSKSAYLRYLEALGEEITIPKGCYPGDYLKPIGQKLKEKYGDKLKEKSEEEYISMIREFVVDEMMELIKADLKQMGIVHDVFFSEKKELHEKDAMKNALQFLWDKDLLYKGTLPPPKGYENENYVQKELTLFRAKQFGDDEDRAVLKNDGTPTYLAGDIPYTKNKIDRGFTKMFIILGADHAGYVKRVKAIASAVSDRKAEMEVFLTSMVRFMDKGKPFKMSKRAGTFVTAKDVVDEVGKDILRFIMLTRHLSAPMDFDFSKVREQSKDNPVFYVQYANARCHSVFRKAKKEMKIEVGDLKNTNHSLLNHKEEISLLKKLGEYPKVVKSSVVNYEPHRITFYLQELASKFHSLWNVGGDLKFIVENNKELTKSRLTLVKAVSNVIESGLIVLGVEPATKME